MATHLVLLFYLLFIIFAVRLLSMMERNILNTSTIYCCCLCKPYISSYSIRNTVLCPFWALIRQIMSSILILLPVFSFTYFKRISVRLDHYAKQYANLCSRSLGNCVADWPNTYNCKGQPNPEN